MQKELLKIDEKEITFACYKTCCESMEQLIKIVEGAFSMDTLGIKDKVRSAGLSKNFKKQTCELISYKYKQKQGTN